jgi:hypothetical protein
MFMPMSRSLHQAMLLALIYLLAWLPGVATAQQRALEKAYWTDPSGSASFEQARASVHTPYSDLLSKGFSRHVQWVRLKIAPLPGNEGDALAQRISRQGPVSSRSHTSAIPAATTATP